MVDARATTDEDAETGVVGLRIAMERLDMGISVKTGFLDNAPRRALHPAPCVDQNQHRLRPYTATLRWISISNAILLLRARMLVMFIEL